MLADDFEFRGESWARMCDDGRVRVGAFAARPGTSPRAVLLPRAGDLLMQGQPMAELMLADGSSRVFNAPMSGEVVDVHEGLRIDPHPLWFDPCNQGWIAHLKPTQPFCDLWGCAPRDVVLLGGVGSPLVRRWLEYYGCTVVLASTAEEVLAAVERTQASLVIVDAVSLGRFGVAAAAELESRLGDARLVAAMHPESRLRSTYARLGVECIEVDPIFDSQLATLLHGAFAPPLAHA